ncbi:MAG: baseplate J/gp47 family protein [Candidatus Promineifilaceae bacterium]
MTALERELAVQAIFLNEDDDIVSIQDRLNWVEAHRVLLVLPEEGDLLAEHLDLALLRRRADELRLEVGLITGDGRVRGHAKVLGFPIFSSIEAAEKSQRAWWRGRRRWEHVGKTIHLDEYDRKEVQRRTVPRPIWQRWLLRYAAIVGFFLTLAVLFVASAYAIPGATITLRPEVQPLQVVKQIVADPQLESVNFSGASVPGRTLVVEEEWQSNVETTGTIEVPDAPARGTVVFVNEIAQPVTVPAGTRVSTSADSRIVFQTLSSVEVPGVVGGTAEVDVVAIEPGAEGNVKANLVNRIEGTLALQLQVRNLEPMEGGGVRLAQSVTEADQERLHAQVLQQLQTLALADMEEILVGDEFLARDSLRVSQILHETYSNFPGEQTNRLTLEIRAELVATAVDETQANGLVYEELASAVKPGYELVPESLDFRSGEVLGVDSEGRVTFEMIGQGQIAAQFAVEGPVRKVAGQESEVGMAYLNDVLPLRDYPTVRIWPDWFGRLPYLPIRIQTEIEVAE